MKTTRQKRQPKWLPYRLRASLLSRGELAFFRVLQAALGQSYLIAPKVRLADLLTCSDTAWDAGFGHFIARQHLDFVLCDPATSEFLVAIELDDRSHDLPRRQARDKFLDRALRTARFPLVRIRAQSRYDARTIAAQIEGELYAA